MATWERINQNILTENRRLQKENNELAASARLAWWCALALLATLVAMVVTVSHL